MAYLTKSGSAVTSASRSLAAVFLRLDQDWQRVSSSSASTLAARELARAHPVFARCENLGDVVSLVRWEGRYPTTETGPVLAALLVRATYPLVARALLQALLPRVRREKVALPMYGHGLGEYCQGPDDTMNDLVAECYAAIRRHAGEERNDVARLVVQEAARKVRTARQGQRRYQQRTEPLAEDVPALPSRVSSLDGRAAVDLWSARTAVEWLASAVVDAMRCGHLTVKEARLVYLARVWGLRASEVGRREGLPEKAVYYALARAEQALTRRAA